MSYLARRYGDCGISNLLIQKQSGDLVFENILDVIIFRSMIIEWWFQVPSKAVDVTTPISRADRMRLSSYPAYIFDNCQQDDFETNLRDKYISCCILDKAYPHAIMSHMLNGNKKTVINDSSVDYGRLLENTDVVVSTSIGWNRIARQRMMLLNVTRNSAPVRFIIARIVTFVFGWSDASYLQRAPRRTCIFARPFDSSHPRPFRNCGTPRERSETATVVTSAVSNEDFTRKFLRDAGCCFATSCDLSRLRKVLRGVSSSFELLWSFLVRCKLFHNWKMPIIAGLFGTNSLTVDCQISPRLEPSDNISIKTHLTRIRVRSPLFVAAPTRRPTPSVSALSAPTMLQRQGRTILLEKERSHESKVSSISFFTVALVKRDKSKDMSRDPTVYKNCR